MLKLFCSGGCHGCHGNLRLGSQETPHLVPVPVDVLVYLHKVTSMLWRCGGRRGQLHESVNLRPHPLLSC